MGLGGLCALATLTGWLARPEDELAGVMRLHPRIRATDPVYGPDAKEYDFDAPVSKVVAMLPGSKSLRWRNGGSFSYRVCLPSGKTGDFNRYEEFFGLPYSCSLVIYGSYQPTPPWYEQTWSTIRWRLGIR